MIEVEMMKDIRKYENKFLGPFTKRQIVCIGISLIYEVPFIIFFKFIPIDTRCIIASILFIPMYFCGWQKKYGMPYEIYATRLIYRLFMVPAKRIYKNNNIFRYYNEQIKKKNLILAQKISDKKPKVNRKKNEAIPIEYTPYK